MMAIVLQAGAPQATAYLLPKLPPNQGKDLLRKILLFLFANGLILSFVLYFGANIAGDLLRSPQLPELLRLYAPMPALIVPTLALPGVCMAHGRPGLLASFQIISKLIAFFAVATPILLGYTVKTSIMVWLSASSITVVIAIAVMYIPYHGCATGRSPYGMVDVFRFGLPLAAASIAGILLAGADRFIVSRFFGPEVFAQYVNGAVQLPVLEIVTGSTAVVLLPVFSRLADSKRGNAEAKAIWVRVVQKNAAFLYACAWFAFFFSEDIMRLLYSEKYVGSSLFFRIYLGVTLIRVVPYLPLMLGFGAVRSYLAGAILACLIAWGGAFLVCVRFSNPAFAAASYVCAVYVMSFFFIGVISRRLGVRIASLLPWKELSAYVAAGALAGLLSWAITMQITGSSFSIVLVRLIGGLGMFSVSYIVCARAFGLDTIAIVKPVIHGLSNVKMRLSSPQ